MKSPNKLVGALLVSALTVGSTFPGGAFEAAFPHALPVQEVVEVAADGTLRPLEWVGSGMNYLRNSVPSGFSMSSFAIPAFASWENAQQLVSAHPKVTTAAALSVAGLAAVGGYKLWKKCPNIRKNAGKFAAFAARLAVPLAFVAKDIA